MTFCPGEHAWPNTYKVSDLYSSENPPSVEKAPKCYSKRGPQGVEVNSGRVSPYNSSGTSEGKHAQSARTGIVKPKVDYCKQRTSSPPIVCQDIVLPNPITRKSFEPWDGGPTKPCYRKKTSLGVYVGIQTMPDTQPLDLETVRPWDNDTWIPRDGIFTKFSP